MSAPLLSVVIPTIPPRVEHLERCVNAYKETGPSEVELIIVEDKPTCGIGWNVGAELATGEYLALTCDDIEPLSGWFEAAVTSALRNEMPAPRIVGPDGKLQQCGDTSKAVEHEDGWHAPYSSLPFFRRELWSTLGPTLDCHYFTDDWLSFTAREAGMDVVVNRNYLFAHHWAQEGRGDDAARMGRDRKIYQQAVSEWRERMAASSN